jgi:ATP-dependent exoDNAse (exonuclease V) beta subunit
VSARPVVDARERAAALDPARSCIVQAPAGSGKTGLLIQRVLRLLATVERPEEILAITFTRKAAAEMRRRVLQALGDAAVGAPLAGEANARLTRELAEAALARDRERGWRVLDNPARLRIQTIDALCASLARQMPVLSGMGAAPAIVDDARELYREAAQRTLARVEGGDARALPIERLLAHLDGDWALACTLIEGMLARRDQWVGRAAEFEASGAMRAALEQAFRVERMRIMARARALLPEEHERMLAGLAGHAAAHHADAGPDESVADFVALADLAGLTGYPAVGEEGAAAWCALAALLLVQDERDVKFRQRVHKGHGFPSDNDALRAVRDRMQALLDRLARVEGLCEALDALRRMPPAAFTDAQWEALGAVVAVLPRAADELRHVFAEHGAIDFTAIAQAAVQALGEPDDPTDLLLALDVRLKHLLVDEFQDTSRSQWELLVRLTAGWVEGDGRTVFLVGDPMQSIYRFREADVALFLRARESGLPEVPLVPLRLATNFRSRGGIVAWVNDAFQSVLAAREDADAGAVPYAPSSAHHPSGAGPAVRWHAFVGRDEKASREAEARAVARLARAALEAGPAASVAILVRFRSHLDRIVPALKEARIRFRAVDIEPLGARPAIQDLLAVTRALAHPADRVAWLALLRAPWCALTAAELHLLVEAADLFDDPHATVWEMLCDEAHLARLGREPRERVRRVRERLAPFVAGRLRGPLRERVEAAWLALGGAACARAPSDLEDAETFFDQLDQLERAGDIPDPAVLEEHLGELYAAPDLDPEARLQVMTIHKAKGLEFDTVIVPGLDRPPHAGDKPLFAWKARADGTLMMAPVRAAGEAREAAYDYLRMLDEAAGEHEAGRLLYVAATRAARELHLAGCAGVDARSGVERVRRPGSRSLLGKVWDAARIEFERALAAPAREEGAPPATVKGPGELVILARKALDVAVAAPVARAPEPVADAAIEIEFSWAGETARHIGIVTHRWLQRIAADGVEAWDAARVAALEPAVDADLARRGIPPAERVDAIERVLAALESALADPRGRWVLAAHSGARSEYRLRIATPSGVKLAVIDRTFVDGDGRRWIVDYKTSVHEGADAEGFLDRELERYRPQLAGYAAAFPGEPVALGLYFPLMNGWRESVP